MKTSPVTIAHAAARINGLSLAIHRASGPSAYDKYVVTCRPISEALTIA